MNPEVVPAFGFLIFQIVTFTVPPVKALFKVIIIVVPISLQDENEVIAPEIWHVGGLGMTLKLLPGNSILIYPPEGIEVTGVN